jgi:hypothetical protein
MQLVAVASIVVIWCAIAALLTILPGPRRWVALCALAAVLALNTSIGPLQLDVYGFEIIGNFFFAEAVGQAVVWWLVWFTVHRRLTGHSPISTAVPIAVVAVALTFVHVLPAVELLVLVGCLCATELLERRRSGLRTWRSYAPPIALVAAATVAFVLTPGFRAMRAIAANNGSLDVPYLSGLAGYIAVAVAVAVVSAVLLAVSGSRRDETETAAVLQGLGFIGIATAAPCLVQALALTAGQGSQYAVKKYVFGLLTILVVDACVAVAAFVPRTAIGAPRSRPAVRFAATVTLAVVAILSVFSRAEFTYSMAVVTTLERHVFAVADAASLRTHKDAHAVGLPNSDRVLDYMFSRAVFAEPQDHAALAILQGRPELASGDIITSATSPYQISTCRTFGPREDLIVVDIGCWARTANKCHPVNDLSEAGLVEDPRLHGFSFAEPTGRWTDGRSASFSCVFSGKPPRTPLRITLAGTAFLPPGVRHQRVTLAVGGERKQFVFTPEKPRAVIHLTVPRPTANRLTLDLTLPDAVSPHTLGLSIDSRTLALFVKEIRID